MVLYDVRGHGVYEPAKRPDPDALLHKLLLDALHVHGFFHLHHTDCSQHPDIFNLFEFAATPETIAALELEYRRDEKVMRFLTVSLDKHAVAYNEKRRRGEFNKKPEAKEEQAA